MSLKDHNKQCFLQVGKDHDPPISSKEKSKSEIQNKSRSERRSKKNSVINDDIETIVDSNDSNINKQILNQQKEQTQMIKNLCNLL